MRQNLFFLFLTRNLAEYSRSSRSVFLCPNFPSGAGISSPAEGLRKRFWLSDSSVAGGGCNMWRCRMNLCGNRGVSDPQQSRGVTFNLQRKRRCQQYEPWKTVARVQTAATGVELNEWQILAAAANCLCRASQKLNSTCHTSAPLTASASDHAVEASSAAVWHSSRAA